MPPLTVKHLIGTAYPPETSAFPTAAHLGPLDDGVLDAFLSEID